MARKHRPGTNQYQDLGLGQDKNRDPLTLPLIGLPADINVKTIRCREIWGGRCRHPVAPPDYIHDNGACVDKAAQSAEGIHPAPTLPPAVLYQMAKSDSSFALLALSHYEGDLPPAVLAHLSPDKLLNHLMTRYIRVLQQKTTAPPPPDTKVKGQAPSNNGAGGGGESAPSLRPNHYYTAAQRATQRFIQRHDAPPSYLTSWGDALKRRYNDKGSPRSVLDSMMESLLTHPNCPNSFIDWVCSDVDNYHFHSLILDRDELDPDWFAVIAETDDPRLCATILAHPKCPPELKQQLTNRTVVYAPKQPVGNPSQAIPVPTP